MRKHTTLTHERLTEVLTYRPRSGKFTWRVSTATHIMPGREAGTVYRDGRRVICIDGELYKASVLAWFYMKKKWPRKEKLIDHQDRNKGNDKWNNLREVSDLQNCWNREYKNKHVGITRRENGKFRVRIGHKGSRRTLGTFDTIGEAISVRRISFQKFHGEVFG